MGGNNDAFNPTRDCSHITITTDAFNLRGIGVYGEDFVTGAPKLIEDQIGGLAALSRDARYCQAPASKKSRDWIGNF
jgi:hypothetical protein